LCDNQYDADGIASLFTEDAVWESPALGRFEGREAIRSFFQGASGIFSFAIHYSLNGHIEVESDTARAPPVSLHAVYGGRTKSSGVARRYRSRDVRPGGWDLDVPPQAVGAADERPVRDWLGQGAFRVTGVSADRLIISPACSRMPSISWALYPFAATPSASFAAHERHTLTGGSPFWGVLPMSPREKLAEPARSSRIGWKASLIGWKASLMGGFNSC
jgi:hypothetical protein